MEQVISFVVQTWPACKRIIIGKDDVQNQDAVLSQLDIIEELIEIIDRTIDIKRFNETITEFIKQVKCITASIKGIALIQGACSAATVWLHESNMDVLKFMRCNMNSYSYDEKYHKMHGDDEFEVIMHAIIKNMLEEEEKEKIMNKINDQQGGYTSKDADHSDKIICDQQNQAIVVDNQDKNKFNVVMNNHNNQNDKMNCNQQNKLNFVDNICENKSVFNVVDKNHNKDIEEINHCHENEFNFVHNNHNNHGEQINNYQQINFDNNMCQNDNYLNVVEKKINFKVVNHKHDNNIGKINAGQQYKIDCAKNKHENKIKLKLVNDKIKNKIKCKIKYRHLINNNNGERHKFDGHRYLCHLETFVDFDLTSQLKDGNAELLWLMSFASCQGPGGVLLVILIQPTSILYIVYDILEVKFNGCMMDASATIC